MKKIILSGVLIITAFSLNAFAAYSPIIEKAKTVITDLTKKSNDASANLSDQSDRLQGAMDILGKGVTTTTNDIASTVQDLTSNTERPAKLREGIGKLTTGQDAQKKLLQTQQAKLLTAKQRLAKDKKVERMLAQAKARNASKKIKK